MPNHRIGTQEEWQAARDEVLSVLVEKNYQFETDEYEESARPGARA